MRSIHSFYCKLANTKGFTMMEVMVSLSLFGIVSAGLMPAFTSFMKFNTQAHLKTQAYTAAQQKLDQLRLSSPQHMPTSGTQGPEDFAFGDRTFQIYTTYCPVNTFCTSNNNRHIRVEAFYLGEQKAEIDTVYTSLR